MKQTARYRNNNNNAFKQQAMNSLSFFTWIHSAFQIWSLGNYKCYYTFTGEHSRHGIFKNISQGVSQVMIDEYNRLFSCGADGSMKVRQLPDRDIMFNNYVHPTET